MFATHVRRAVLPAPQPLGSWCRRWLRWRQSEAAPTTPISPFASPLAGASVLPDAAVDAWLRWLKAPERESGVPPDHLVCIPDVLSHLSSNTDGLQHKLAMQGDAVQGINSGAARDVHSLAPVTLGHLQEAICPRYHVSRNACGLPLSLEALFLLLRRYTPLLLRLDCPATTASMSALHTYCQEAVVRTTGSQGSRRIGGGSAYVQRQLREVAVSWQPWVSDAQRKRLSRSTAAPGVMSECAALSEASCDLPSKRDTYGRRVDCRVTVSAASTVSSTSGERDHLEAQRSWQCLLDHVPSFFVSAELARADVVRAHPRDGPQLWASWLRPASGDGGAALEREATKLAATESRSRGDAAAGCCRLGSPLPAGPFLEVSADGLAVRAPSMERCLQAGCPASLLYGSAREGQSSPRARYSLLLLRGTRGGDDSVMHYALSLLASTVPTQPCLLRDVRRLFAAASLVNSDASFSGAQGPPPCPPLHAAATPECRACIPCVEVLLDHPDLAFAVRLTDHTGQLTHATLPFQHPRADASRSGVVDTTRVQLHAAFAHPLRGTADVALVAMRRARWRAASDGALPSSPSRRGCVASVHLVDTMDELAARCAAVQPPAATAEGERDEDTGEQAAPLRALSVAYMSSWAMADTKAAGTTTSAVSLIIALVSEWQRVDVFLVPRSVVSALAARLRGGVSSTDTSGADAQEAELMALLVGSSTVRVVSSRAFSGGEESCNGLGTLLSALPDSAAASLCTLRHVTCYTGYPAGAVAAGEAVEDADRLLAAAVLQRHEVSVEYPTDRTGSDRWAELEDHSRQEVRKAACVALAAYTLLRGAHEEQQQQVHTAAEGTPATVEGDGSSREREVTFQRWMEARGHSPNAMDSHACALRLSRYLRWLSSLDGHGRDETLSCKADAAEGSLSSAALSAAGQAAALRALVDRYGPEPFPPMTWMESAAPSASSNSAPPVAEAAAAGGCATTVTPESQHAAPEAAADHRVPPQSAEWSASEFGASVDATLYDALLREAAAVQESAASSSATAPTTPFATRRCAAEGGPPTEPETVHVTAPEDAPQEADTLDFYLANLLDSADTTVRAAPPAHPPAAPAPPLPSPSPSLSCASAVGADALTSLYDAVSGGGAHAESCGVPAPSSFALSAQEGVADAPPPAVGGGASSLHPLPPGFIIGPPLPARRGVRRHGGGEHFAAGQPPLPVPAAPLWASPPYTGSVASQVQEAAREFDRGQLQQQHTTAPQSLYYSPVAQPAPLQGGAGVARFDRFAAWAPERGGAPPARRGGLGFAASAPTPPFAPPPSPPAAPPLPPPPPSTPLAPPLPLRAGVVQPEPGRAGDNAADFLGRVSEAERLRLASLIVDILKGTSRSPPPPSTD